MNGRICPFCGKTLPVSEAVFCAFCGKPLGQDHAVQERVRSVLNTYRNEKDPVRKHQLLSEALLKDPDSLELNEELLFLGRLHERNARTVDFSVIKCWLLQIYLDPKVLKAEKHAAMRKEIFDHPQLHRCLEIADDPAEWNRHYLKRLSAEFITLFLRGSNIYMRSLLGFRLEQRAGKLLAAPARDILIAIRRDTELTSEQRNELYGAFYQAFYENVEGDISWLDSMLERYGYPLPKG